MVIDRPNQVWCADLTYIPMRRGFLYLVAVMDWATRKVLSWRVSNTMDVEVCLEALEEAMARFGRPEIFNSERRSATGPSDGASQGSQFTSPRFTSVLQQAGVRVSMDGRGRWMDNVLIERLWRSLKYECVYLYAFETGSELRAGLAKWIGYYNVARSHSALGGRTPDEAYGASGREAERLAA
jgi:putative transposase